ncbi:MAG: A/G-specific adenine glycosylase [Cyclobacteriaceae bacterium]|nr:A/G-specific adenine glycosylase [Cyclobacteriaceae bacterium]
MKATVFSAKVVEWYQEHHRLLPWRQTRDPYKIWLSEIILQQTRVAQGLPYYRAFVRQYPNVRSLAAASEQEVLRMWQGLGYYSRARNLHACARMIAKKYQGNFPQTFVELKQLRGVGDYTAAAIASFAFGERVAVLDGNVFRVLSRVFGVSDDIASPAGKRKFMALANDLLPVKDSSTYNQAIMEFGALFCTPRSPSCDQCPLSAGCVAFRRGMQADLPVKRKSVKTKRRYFHYVVARRGKSVLMNRRTGQDIWKGLWDFPLVESETRLSKGELERTIKKVVGEGTSATVSPEYKHVLSHQVIAARFLEISIPKESDWPRGGLFASAIPCGPGKVQRLPKSVLVARYLRENGAGE